MIVGPAGLPNVPFADLVPAVSPFRPWLSGVGSRIEHMSERVLGVVEREALDRARTCFTPPPWIDPDQQPRLGGRPRVPL
jgi:hypothetical protein